MEGTNTFCDGSMPNMEKSLANNKEELWYVPVLSSWEWESAAAPLNFTDSLYRT